MYPSYKSTGKGNIPRVPVFKENPSSASEMLKYNIYKRATFICINSPETKQKSYQNTLYNVSVRAFTECSS